MIGNAAWGIDLSGGSLKAVRVVRLGTRRKVTDVVDQPYSEPGVGSQKLTARPGMAVHRAIDVFLQAHSSSLADPVYVGIHGYGARTGETVLPTADPEKARQFLDYELHGILRGDPDEWIVRSSHRESRLREQDRVRFLAQRRAIVDPFLAQLDHAGLPVDGLFLEPLALERFLQEEWPERERRLALQIQRVRTDVLLLGEREPKFRSLPVGAGVLLGARESRTPPITETRRLARRIVHEFTSAAEHHFGGAGFVPERVLLIGEGAGIPALRHVLAEELESEVETLDRLRNLKLAGSLHTSASLDAAQMGSALGLALLALDRRPSPFNLAEPSAARRRARRRPAVAASLLLAAAGVFTVHGLVHRDLADQRAFERAHDHSSDWSRRDEIDRIHRGAAEQTAERAELLWRVADLRRQLPEPAHILDRLSGPTAFFRVRELNLAGDRAGDDVEFVVEVEGGLATTPDAVLEWTRDNLRGLSSLTVEPVDSGDENWVAVRVRGRWGEPG